MSTYEPGTVAVATVRGVKGARVVRSGGDREQFWITPDRQCGDRYHSDKDVTDVRVLVVLDLDGWDGPELVEALREVAKQAARPTGADLLVLSIANQIEAQTKPPRIPEPGLWGVVEARIEGLPTRRWVHHEEDRWICDIGVPLRYWEDLIDPTLVRPGIEESS